MLTMNDVKELVRLLVKNPPTHSEVEFINRCIKDIVAFIETQDTKTNEKQ